MRQKDCIAVIERFAYPAAAASWDASGMQVAGLRDDVRRVAVCLDPTPASVSAALDGGADFILSHHPLLLKGRLPSRPDAYHAVLRLLLRADVPLYAAHTSLDVNVYGPAGWLADELGLTNRTVLEPVGHDAPQGPLGYGLAGDLPEALPPAELARALGRHIDLSTAVICGTPPALVRRVSYCTGSGSSMWPAAAALGADVHITGDVKYHTALDADICMIDVGHHSLEEEMMRRMALLLAGELPGTDVFFVPSASPLRPLADAADSRF